MDPMEEISIIEREVDADYQHKQGNYNVYLKGIYRLLLFYVRYKVGKESFSGKLKGR